jgi:Spondin_N
LEDPVRRTSLAVTAAAVAFALLGSPASADRVVTYEVTVTNLTTGQWLTPPAAATHDDGFVLWRVGNSATVATKEIAENGNLDAATGAFQASPLVFDWKVTPSPTGPPPIAPGASVSFEITAPPQARFSFASMLICTNDGFTGVDAIRLPRGHRGVVHHLAAYDAGTEVNTEAWADLVPPCAQLTGFGDQGGTGVSNPALFENGVVAHHPGIAGSGDLVPAVHGWTEPVAMIEIQRVD